jgi:hypothetical protein
VVEVEFGGGSWDPLTSAQSSASLASFSLELVVGGVEEAGGGTTRARTPVCLEAGPGVLTRAGAVGSLVCVMEGPEGAFPMTSRSDLIRLPTMALPTDER